MSSSWIFKLGHFNIGVHVFSPEFNSDIKELLQSLSLNVGFNSTSQDAIHLVFVTPDAPKDFVDSLELPEWGKPMCKNLFKVAKTISEDSDSNYLKSEDYSNIIDFKLGDWLIPEQRIIISHQKDQLVCFAFVSEKEAMRDVLLNRILGHIYLLAIYWSTLNNGLLIHSAAVAYNGGGYLFLGGGGAGNSTAARLAATVGATVLSDDLAFVLKAANNRYELAAAPGPVSRFTMNPYLYPKLRGVFCLKQDSQDLLIPLTSGAIAHAVFRSFEWSHWIEYLSPSMVSMAFHTACDIARKSKGYELHFRKSPDFWKIVDEQFSD